MDKKAADKKAARLRRGLRARHKIRELGVYRLCVHRTPDPYLRPAHQPGPDRRPDPGRRLDRWSRRCARLSRAPATSRRPRRWARRSPRRPRRWA